MDREFTATVYIIENEHVLLIFHKKLAKWLPPGGHMEANETPPETARREVLEETGLEIEFITQENVWIDRWNAKSIERPYLCLLEEIPQYRDRPAHQHIDFVYVGRPTGGIKHDDAKWFTLEDVEAMEGDEDIFEETRHTIRHLLNRRCASCADITLSSLPQPDKM